MPTVPVISWPGNKRLLAKQIVPLIPEHRCYVEPFGGSLAVLLAKPRSKMEVVNDLNEELINFYRCVRFHLDEMLRELEWVPNARQEFVDFLEQQGLTDIQRAVRWFIRNKFSFGGLGGHFATSTKSSGGVMSSREARIDRLRELNRRLDRVLVENLPWQKCLERYDGEGIFFFLDPPYFSGYQYDVQTWTAEDHQTLRDRIFALQGEWILTYDDVPEVRDLYAGCVFIEISRKRGIGNNHPSLRREFRELIIRSGERSRS